VNIFQDNSAFKEATQLTKTTGSNMNLALSSILPEKNRATEKITEQQIIHSLKA